MEVIRGELLDVPIDFPRAHPNNPREHDIGAIYESITENGFYGRILIQRSTGYILKGHGTWESARQAGADAIPAEVIDVDDNVARRILLADNRTSDRASYNLAELEKLLNIQIKSTGGLTGTGYDADDYDDLLADLKRAQGEAETTPEAEARRTLADRFLAPPFSILDARQGYWQERKRAWIALGINSVAGRGEGLALDAISAADPQFYKQKGEVEAKLGRKITTAEYLAEHYVSPNDAVSSGTSIFDPVLAETLVTWFSSGDARILDPFAGGSVRGIVAAMLGREYVGIDLRPEQVAENTEQAERIGQLPGAATWIQGDSTNMGGIELGPDREFDFIFTCPPYYDLEHYSDDPWDLSNAETYEEFLSSYNEAIRAACARLRPNRFAAFVVSDIRDKTGFYRNFISHTIEAFERAGLRLYNEIIFITPAGSLPVRAGRQFSATRKAGKTHQNALVFYKEDEVLADSDLELTHEKVLVFANGAPDREHLGEVAVDEAISEAVRQQQAATIGLDVTD